MPVVDHELLSRLLDEHSGALVLYAQQWCGTPEDVVQEAFIRLMRQQPAPANIVGWLYRVVRNEAVSATRSVTRRNRHESSAGAAREPWFEPSFNDAIDAATVAAVLTSLPMDAREVIVLRIWGGRSFDEIAELIGKSTSTAHRRFEQGLERLRAECISGRNQGNSNERRTR